jgi:hypothetical protein
MRPCVSRIWRWGLLLVAQAAWAGPSATIWNPNTDVQAAGTVNLGIDNYFSFRRHDRPYAAPTTLCLVGGLPAGFEVGLDAALPGHYPWSVHAKWARPEGRRAPALACGVQAVGLHKSTMANIAYVLAAKTWEPVGRFTVGPYGGRRGVIGRDNLGAILSWDRALGRRWWLAADYATGHNANGALAVGGSYRFAEKATLLLGYVHYNAREYYPNDALTTQLAVEF